jgi:AcrR family transcriptional regulator
MGSPGFSMRLSRAERHESAYPVLVAQMSAMSTDPHDRHNGEPTRAATAEGGQGAPESPGIGPRRARRPRRGRPRSANTDRVILVAAAALLEEKGINGLSIEEVAERAGVGKTTIYRRWSSRGTLALDAFLAEHGRQRVLPDTGTFAGDLRAALGVWVGAVSGTSAVAMLGGLIAEIQHDQNLAAAWRVQVIAPLRAQYSIMVDRGVTRGEIPAETDAGVVLDLLFGACYYRLLQRQRPVNEQFINQVVDVVAAGVGARASLSASRPSRRISWPLRNLFAARSSRRATRG